MLKRLVILAVLVLGIVYSAWPQIPRDGSQQDRPAQREADKSQLAQPSPPTLQVQTSPAKQEEGAKEKPSGYPWDELLAPANIPNWMLCIVGAVAGIAAVLTLNAIKRQANTMDKSAADARASAAAADIDNAATLAALTRQADSLAAQASHMAAQTEILKSSVAAAQTSADASLSQIKAMKAKERGRLIVELADYSPLRYSGPLEAGQDFVRLRVRLYGITDVLEVYSSCFVCIGDPEGSAESIFGVENIPLPSIISTDGRLNEADIQLRLSTNTNHSLLSYEAVWAGEVSVFCEGFIMYQDIFEDRWITSFKKMWQFYPNWRDRPEGERGHWVINDGDEDQNREEPVKSELDPGPN